MTAILALAGIVAGVNPALAGGDTGVISAVSVNGKVGHHGDTISIPEGAEAIEVKAAFRTTAGAQVAGSVEFTLTLADGSDVQGSVALANSAAAWTHKVLVDTAFTATLSFNLKAAETSLGSAGAIELKGAAAKAGKAKIAKLKNPSVAKGKKAKVVPQVTLTGKAKVTSKKITVTRNGKTVAKNKASAKLKAGTYKVKTTVKYKTYTIAHTPLVTKKTVTAKQGDKIDVNCTASGVTTFTMGGRVVSALVFDLSCGSEKLAAPITAESTSCVNGFTCSGVGIVAKQQLSSTSTSFSATYTAPSDIVTNATTGGEAYKKYSAKAKTATKTQTLKVKTKKK
ncbi:MAG: hypothetical protein LBT54_04855 [Bifidobacteriaceae bacterium]|jgi:hypothetical protein|nr:hypothetical protein [Bifidobacteriaceae bacterium]